MTRWRLLTAASLAAALAISTPLLAQEQKPAAKASAEKPAAEKEKEEPPAKFVRQHRMHVATGEVAYTTTAEEIILKDGEGKSTARFFTISYTKDGVTN